jgi:hypothetical protein
VCRSPPPYQCIAFVDRRNNLSGHVNLLNFFNLHDLVGLDAWLIDAVPDLQWRRTRVNEQQVREIHHG